MEEYLLIVDGRIKRVNKRLAEDVLQNFYLKCVLKHIKIEDISDSRVYDVICKTNELTAQNIAEEKAIAIAMQDA